MVQSEIDNRTFIFKRKVRLCLKQGRQNKAFLKSTFCLNSGARFVYEITRTWNDLPTNHSVIQFTLVSHEEGVKILMKAPFFNDPPNPGGPPGEPFPGLWDYEGIQINT